MRRRDAAWSVALEDNCVRGAVMCCSLLYPVLAARLLALYRLVEFDDLVMLEPDLRLSSDAARPWQMAGLPFTFLLVVGMPCAALAVLWRTARPGALDKPHIKPAEKVRLEARYLRRYGQLYQMYEPPSLTLSLTLTPTPTLTLTLPLPPGITTRCSPSGSRSPSGRC